MVRAACILIFAVLIHKTGTGQGGLPLILIKNEVTGEPIPQVHVRDLASKRFWISDDEGLAALDGARFPIKLKCTHVGYEDHAFEVDAWDPQRETPLLITLRPRMVMLGQVEISRPGPEVIYQRDDLHVGAFHVNADGLWVLVYDRERMWHRQENAGQQVLKNASLHLLDTDLRERAVHHFRSPVAGLHWDHADRVVVEAEHEAWIAEPRGDAIVVASIELDVLRRAVLPWRASLAGSLLGSDQVGTYPAFHHLAYDTISHTIDTICTVQDDHVMQLFRSQYKYMSGRDKVMAMDLEKRTGVDKEVIAGYMTRFHEDIYFIVPYAPLFVARDTILVFDHITDRLLRFDARRVPAGSTAISHHKQRGKSVKLIQDRADQRIYAMHARNGRTTLRLIDTATGELGSEFTLTHPYPEEVQVHGGHAWYIYRPFGSLQRRTLYREGLAAGR